MLSTKESIILLSVTDKRNVSYELLTDEQRVVVDELVRKGYVFVDPNDSVTATAPAVTLVKIFRSGLNFDLMLRRLNFKSITKLIHQSFQKAFRDGIHLNVIFKNMTDEELDLIQQELTIAKEKRSMNAQKA